MQSVLWLWYFLSCEIIVDPETVYTRREWSWLFLCVSTGGRDFSKIIVSHMGKLRKVQKQVQDPGLPTPWLCKVLHGGTTLGSLYNLLCKKQLSSNIHRRTLVGIQKQKRMLGGFSHFYNLDGSGVEARGNIFGVTDLGLNPRIRSYKLRELRQVV